MFGHVWGLDLALIDWLGARRSQQVFILLRVWSDLIYWSSARAINNEMLSLPLNLSCPSLDYRHASFSALPLSFYYLSLFILLLNI
jgi:hypothetical protein